MPESQFAETLGVVVSCLGLTLLVGQWLARRTARRIEQRLIRIEQLLENRKPEHQADEVAVSEAESASESSDSAFSRFLEQYPDCRDLPKSEQSRAYRKWRKQQGLNWVSR